MPARSSRRHLLPALAAWPAALLGGRVAAGQPATPTGCDAERIVALEARVRALSFNVASGGGVNLKLMPDPLTGAASVPLPEVFSFDRLHALCRVETNPAAFLLPTHALGDLYVAPHTFFMAMEATTIEQFAVTTDAAGVRTAVLRGGLSCVTEVGQATVTLGSRGAAEHATYRIEAVDAGVGGGAAGDRFAFTVAFDPVEAPVNYDLFGPEATFTGEMILGEITIVDPGA